MDENHFPMNTFHKNCFEKLKHIRKEFEKTHPSKNVELSILHPLKKRSHCSKEKTICLKCIMFYNIFYTNGFTEIEHSLPSNV